MFPLKNVARGIAPAVIISGIAATSLVGVGTWLLFSGDDDPEPIGTGEKTDSADILGGHDDVGEGSDSLLLQGISDDDTPTFYEMLGVDEDATQGEIRDACNDQSILYRDTPERLAMIQEACFVLLDQRRRRVYDKILSDDEGYFDTLGLSRDASERDIQNALSLASRRFASAFDSLGLSGIVAYADGTSIYVMVSGGFSGQISAADFQFSDPSVQLTGVHLSGGVIVLTIAEPVTSDGIVLEYSGDTLFFKDGTRIAPFAVFVQRSVALPSIALPALGGFGPGQTGSTLPTITDFRIISRGPGYIDLSWAGINLGNIDPRDVTYRILVFAGGACSGTPVQELLVEGGETTTRVTGIEEGEEYSFKIRAEHDGKVGEYSECLSGGESEEDPRAPDEVENFRFGGVGLGFVQLEWDPVPDNGFGIEYYDIVMYQGSDLNRLGSYRIDNDLTEKILPANMDTEYSFRIRSGNYFGVSSFSDYISTKTEDDDDGTGDDDDPLPGSPDIPNLRIRSTGSSFIVPEWDVPADNGSPITRYELRQHVGSGCQYQPAERFIDPEYTAIRVSGRPDSEYSFRIRARNAVGASGYSPCLPATTEPLGDGSDGGDDTGGDPDDDSLPLIPPLPRFDFSFNTLIDFKLIIPDFTFAPVDFTFTPSDFSFVPPEFRFTPPEFTFTPPDFTFSLPRFFLQLQFFKNAFESYDILSDSDARREYINLLIATERGDGLDPGSDQDPGGDDEPPAPGDQDPDETSLFFRGPGDDTDIPGQTPDPVEDDEDPDIDVPPIGRPDPPENLRDEPDGSQVVLVWDVPDGNGYPILGYQVFQFRGSACGVTNTAEEDYETRSAQRVLPNTLDGSYSFRVRARNRIGYGDLSDCFAISLTSLGQAFDPTAPPKIDLGVGERQSTGQAECEDPVTFLVREGGVTTESITLSVLEDSICYDVGSFAGDPVLRQFIVESYVGRGCVARRDPFEEEFSNPETESDPGLGSYFTSNGPFYDLVVDGLDSNQTYSFKVRFILGLGSDASDPSRSKGYGCLEVATLPGEGEFSSVYGGEYGAASPFLSDGGDPNDTESLFNAAIKGAATTIVAGFVACGVQSLIAAGGSALGFEVDLGLRVDPVQAAKECLLDPVVKEFAADIVLKMAADYSQWALGGFGGENPFFTNKERYLKDLLDDARGRIIDRNGLGFLCDINGFNIDISQHLFLKYREIKRRPPRCTGSEALNNVQGIIDQADRFIDNPGDVLQKTQILQFGLINEGDYLLHDNDLPSTYSIDLEKAQRGAFTFINSVAPVNPSAADIPTTDDLTQNDWSVFVSRSETRGEPNLANTPQVRRFSLTLEEIDDQLTTWFSDQSVHSVVAERVLYNLRDSDTGYAVVLRLYLKNYATHTPERLLTGFIPRSLAAAETPGDSAEWGCVRIEDCLTRFDNSKWCATATIGSTYEGSELLEPSRKKWSYRFNPELGSHAAVFLEKEIGFFGLDAANGDLLPPTGNLSGHSDLLCQRSSARGIDTIYAQTVLRITPPVFRIRRDARDNYGFSRRGDKAFFDLSRYGGVLGSPRGGQSTEEAAELIPEIAAKRSQQVTPAQASGITEDDVKEAEDESVKVSSGKNDNSINVWKECEEEDNVDDKALCIEKLKNADDVHDNIQKGDDRILDGVNTIDEFGELFGIIFKNTIVGLVKKIGNSGDYGAMVGTYQATRRDLAKAGLSTRIRNFAGVNDALFDRTSVEGLSDTFLSPYYQLAKAQTVVRDAYLSLRYMIDNRVSINTPAPSVLAARWFNARDEKQTVDLKERLKRNETESLYAFLSGTDDNLYGVMDHLIDDFRFDVNASRTRYVWYDDITTGSRSGPAQTEYLRWLDAQIKLYRKMYEDTVKFYIYLAENADIGIVGDYDNALAQGCEEVFEGREEVCRGEDRGVYAMAYRLLETGEAKILIKAGEEGMASYIARGKGCDLSGETITFRPSASETLTYTTLECSIEEFGEYIEEVLVKSTLDVGYLIRLLYSGTNEDNSSVFSLPHPSNDDSDSEQKRKRVSDIFTIVPENLQGTAATSLGFYRENRLGELAGDQDKAEEKYRDFKEQKERSQYECNVIILRDCVESIREGRGTPNSRCEYSCR